MSQREQTQGGRVEVISGGDPWEDWRRDGQHTLTWCAARQSLRVTGPVGVLVSRYGIYRSQIHIQCRQSDVHACEVMSGIQPLLPDVQSRCAGAVRCGAVRCWCGAGAVRCWCGAVLVRCWGDGSSRLQVLEPYPVPYQS